MRTDGSNELTKDDVIVVSYDKGNMPPQLVKGHANRLRRAAKKVFPNNRILVVDDSVKVSILR